MSRFLSSFRVRTCLCWVTLLGITRVTAAQTPESTPAHAPATIATALAQAGYSAIPFSWDSSGHQVVHATIDATDVALNLDSGFNGILLLSPELSTLAGIHPLHVTGTTATMDGSEQHGMAMVDRIAFGAVQLTDVETSITTAPFEQGFVGVGILQSRQAIVDFVHDTLYVRPTPTVYPVVRPHAAAPTLYAVLKAAGQYHTFLSLMEDANLTPLLKGTTARTPLDSIAWTARVRAVEPLMRDPTLDARALILATRHAFNSQFRKSGQLTAFVPTDAAFAHLSPETLRTLRTDRVQLLRMLRGHLLVDTRVTPVAIRTLIARAAQPDGGALGFFPMGPVLHVERLTSPEEGQLLARATVVDVDSAPNGIVYGIDRVLLGPPDPVLPPALLTQHGYVAIPLYRHQNGTYVVHVTLNGIPVSLVLDTGAPREVIVDEELAARTPDLSSLFAILQFDSATTVTVNTETMNFAEHNNQMRIEDITSPYQGILGSKILQQYGAYVDFATSTLYLALPRHTP